ncbi:MAG: outer membrane protein assembly factor BamB family protein, partial [Microbacterium sp.]
AATAAALLGAAPATASAGAPASGSSGARRGRLALVADTHVNLDDAQSTTWLERVYRAIAARRPDAVLHLGDITDTGLDGEFVRAGVIVPEGLRGRMHYTLGNHEVRWDATAKEVARAHIGGDSYSFDVGGVHVIGFDPTQVLEEPGHYGEAGLQWLRDDIGSVGPHVPVVLFHHYPVGEGFYYFDDQDALVSLLAARNVRAVFAGHVHKETVASFNGFTQATLAAVKNGPTYYVADVADGVLTFSRVELGDGDAETETVVAEIALTGPRRGARLRPESASTGTVSGSAVPVTVVSRRAGAVRVAPYAQHVYGGTQEPEWTELGRSGSALWQGALDVAAVPPGEQRLRLQLERDGARWEQTVRYRVPADGATPSEVWAREMSGPLRAGSVVVGEGARRALIAITRDGEVTAHRPASGETIWKAHVGPVFRRPAVGRHEIYVPSADHSLTALDAARGRVRWRADLGAPVVSQPLLVTGGRRDIVVAAAGEDLVAVDAVRGRERWRVPGRGFFAGRVAHDGDLVFSCATDGFARAHRIEDGTEAWSFPMREGDTHSRTLYSGWNNKLLLAGGHVLVSSVSATWALVPATGEKAWQIDQSFMYAQTQRVGENDVLMTTEFGIMVRADARTGAVLWERDLAARVMDAGVQLHGGSAWAQSMDGQLIQVDLGSGEEIGRSQNGLAYCFGPTALVDDLLVIGDQDGALRAIRLPD